MSDQPAKTAQARQQQSAAAKRATKELLFGKAPRPRDYTADLGDGEKVTFQFLAIGSQRFDRMITDCPPTTAQKAEGGNIDVTKFGPKLLAAVCVDPALPEEDWVQIWKSEAWSSGEIGSLYNVAYGLCLQGLNLTPTEAD